MELPIARTQALTKSPKRLVIYSQYKAGKSSLAAGLESALHIDTEEGADFLDKGSIISVKTYQELNEVCELVKSKGKPYRYGIIDTVTSLESMVLPLALKLYQATPMGKNYKDNILSLPNGAGYLYFRQAFEMMIERVENAFERVILLGHLKDKTIEKGGKEVSAKEIDLTGKIKMITCAKADAIGYLYRDGNKTMLSFETSDEITCGARPSHLRNKKLVLAEYDKETDTLQTYWQKVFID